MGGLRVHNFFTAIFSVAVLTCAFVSLVPRAHAQTASVCPYTWTRTLKVSDGGEDVLKLQQFLNADTQTAVAATGVGSQGNETSTYGKMTRLAVITFQEKYAADILTPNGLTTGTGVVGAATRAKLNSLCAMAAPATISTATTAAPASMPAASALTISMPTQPPPTLAPDGALYVPFTKATFTAGSSDVTIQDMTVERVGPSTDQVFVDVDLLDQDGSSLSTAYFNANHQATFKDAFTVPAGTSKTVTIVGDMAVDLSNYDGQVAGIQINSVDSSSTIVGTLPLRGTEQTINSSLSIGTATALLSPYDPRAATTHYINDTAVRFSGIRITAGSQEDLTMNSITWQQVGTAAASDIASTTVVVDGVSYPATTNDGRYYTATLPSGIAITKGNSVDVYIQGDLTATGSNRTVEFDINSPTDVDLTGNAYGYGIYLVPGGNTGTSGNSVFLTTDGGTDGSSLTPFFAGSVVTISPGALISVGR